MIRCSSALLAVLFIFFASTAQAQTERSDSIDEARDKFVELRETIEEGDIEDAFEMEADLRQMRDSSRQRLGNVERELDAVQSQLAALGDPPGEGDPPESEDLAAERSQLNEEVARLSSQRTRINANIIEANDLLTRISTSRIQGLYEKLFTRGASPVAPAVWESASASAAEVVNKITAFFSEWRQSGSSDDAPSMRLIFIGAAVLVALLLFWPVNRWVQRTFGAAIESRRPTPARRVVVAGLRMLGRTATGIVGGFIIIETLRAQGVLNETGEPAAQAFWFALLIYLLVSGFLSGLFAPSNPAWRIANVDGEKGRTISLLINSIVIVFGTKIVLTAVYEAVGAAPELMRLTEASAAVVVSALLFLLCQSGLWRAAQSMGLTEDDTDDNQGDNKDGEAVDAKPSSPAASAEDQQPTTRWRLVRRIGRALAAITTLAALVGYVGLADFIASRLYYLAIILAIAWFARALLQELGQFLWRRTRADNLTDLDQEERNAREANFKFWNRLLINIALVIAITPAVFVLVGAPPSTVRDIAQQALFGFSIGGVTVPSIAKIAIAIAIFIGIMALTRAAQQGFREGPFKHSKIDSGVQNSLMTLLGYAGLLIALFASISAIGFDLSNLALIAGALSVGIGFGLQSIVNNFVSGLILLFERPIKAGDWIVTASGEGLVQKISVRSTEIQTWDRSSIIVPNSELISSTVTNWTHKNAVGRVTVPVGVAYDSDPDQVKAILLKCIKEHPQILRFPEPFVVWKDFGASSLDFDVRGYISNIGNGLGVRTDLRFAIFKALKEAGVEIPFPQRDVHVKSWPAELEEQAEAQG
ncbi:MAG: DUF3772 domain-containing protein [Pseudomonadota bacterium]